MRSIQCSALSMMIAALGYGPLKNLLICLSARSPRQAAYHQTQMYDQMTRKAHTPILNGKNDRCPFTLEPFPCLIEADTYNWTSVYIRFHLICRLVCKTNVVNYVWEDFELTCLYTNTPDLYNPQTSKKLYLYIGESTSLCINLYTIYNMHNHWFIHSSWTDCYNTPF